jgi:eukaryotic translation initiation factor 2C
MWKTQNFIISLHFISLFIAVPKFNCFNSLIVDQAKSGVTLPSRVGKFNNVGKEISVGLNTFDVLSLPSKPVQQYDISISGINGTPSRMVCMKVWKCRTVQKGLGQGSCLFDGNQLAWYATPSVQPQIR